jgi:DNA adenine methylase
MSITIGYPGSKAGAGVWQRIISLMPRYDHYFEPFLGHGAVFRLKKPAPGSNVGSDVDAGVIKWWTKRRTPARSVVIQEDALRILSTNSAMADPKTLVYLDPPYLLSTRTRRLYAHEFGAVEQHRELLRTIKRLQCMVMISGYASDLYFEELKGWESTFYTAMTRGGLKREYLWMNFPDPGEMRHDCRFVGEGFRERERIGRKRDRWRRRFEKMPLAERQVIREALEAVGR